MNSRAYQLLAVATVACLITVPLTARASGLREQAVAYREEGYERQQHGDLNGALTAYQKAAELDPSYAVPRNDAGIIYEQQGDLERAKQAYQQALVSDPNYVDAHTNAALLAERMGETSAATAHWLKRYELGDTEDAWTARASERLVALGVLTQQGVKGQQAGRRHLEEQEMQAHEQSVKDYEAVTKRWRAP